MLIERIEKSGQGIEAVVDDKAYFVNISKISTKQELKDELLKQINVPDTFDYAKLTLFKELESTTL